MFLLFCVCVRVCVLFYFVFVICLKDMNIEINMLIYYYMILCSSDGMLNGARVKDKKRSFPGISSI